MAAELSITGIALRFLLGGGAVMASAFVARRLGGKAGGLFAAFPAVFLAAVLTSALPQPTAKAAGAAALAVSQGAMAGMAANIACAVSTAFLVRRRGWKKGLALGLGIWAVVAASLFLVLRSLGFIG